VFRHSWLEDTVNVLNGKRRVHIGASLTHVSKETGSLRRVPSIALGVADLAHRLSTLNR
jgi:hypothetical protein